MKIRNNILVAVVGIFVGSASSAQEQRGLKVKISPLKSSYTQGEVVTLDVEVANNHSSDIFVKGADAESGYLKILIASADQKFKQYSHSGWIQGHKGKAMKPGETVKSQATLLWNFSPVHRFVNTARFQEDYIMTDLAFPESGVYFIKAVLIVPGESQTRIESSPVQIVINPPLGEDLTVWNKVKDNAELAYFIQEGEIRSPKSEEQEKFIKEVEQITVNNPNSFLANQIRNSLVKFRESEAKRKEFMENLKQRQKPSN